MILDGRIRARIEASKDALVAENALLSPIHLKACYAAFKDRFGPQRLSGLSGLTLLETMHLHANRDSLVYWLEFKDDAEFPARFGSIAGGSALKFGIYRRKETGVWMKGHATSQVELSTEEAIGIAERHRDQLAAGCNVLGDLPDDADEADYLTAQQRLQQDAPDVQDSSWGHKYFSLLHHDKIDDYHTAGFQDFHLLKCLQTPPDGKGRYVAARQYVQIAAEVGVPLNHLTRILNRAHGRPRRAWRVGTRVTVEGKDGVSIWPQMRSLSVAAIGWDELGDLASTENTREGKVALAKRLQDDGYYVKSLNIARKKAGEILNFIHAMKAGDIVVAADGETVLGVGTAVGDYRYDVDVLPGAPHRRAVTWDDTSPWRLPMAGEGLQTTFYAVEKSENVIALERKLLAPHVDVPPQAEAGATKHTVRLAGVPGRLQDILERKFQAILCGPPGTGKTHWALRTARDLAAAGAFGKAYDDLDQGQKKEVDGRDGGSGLVRTCTFHPGYGYEDFLEGFRPSSSAAEQLTFTLRSGLFRRLCEDAAVSPKREFHLVIDEINRGDIPRIFGELITLLERDKRGRFLDLPVSGDRFTVPANVRIIGTMNTADRSIALLDTALRRRFGFVELLPNYRLLEDAVVGGVPLGPWLQAINGKVRAHAGRDARNLQIGHAFLLEGERPVTEPAKLARIVEEDIVPLLEEYCYADYEKLEKILGHGLVDAAGQRIRDELFTAANLNDLMGALVQPFPDIVTTRTATVHAEYPVDADAADGDEETNDEAHS